MITIGLIDDRNDVRKAFRDKLELTLQQMNIDCSVIDHVPFFDPLEYVPWIYENDLSALIVDERLNESAIDGRNVNYSGHQLVEQLRKTFKNFPIYTVTSYKDDPELKKKFRLFELILSREEFDLKKEEYINLIIHNAGNFLKENKNEFKKLAELSQKIALGKATDKDIEEAKAIQEKLNLPLSVNYVNDRKTWIDDFDSKVKRLENLTTEIEIFLKNKK